MSVDTQPPPDAQAIKEQAAVWLARSTGEDWDDEGRAALEAWLAASTAHKLAYWRLDAGWQRSERLAALQPRLPERTVPSRNVWPLFRVSAGVAAAVVLAVAGTFYALQPTTQTFSTDIGGHRILKLSDGSQIELNTNTQLRVALGDRARTVTLDRGEAYFQIRHDAAHPFVVVAGRERVVDLGTKFVVRREPDRLRVALVEGRAQLETGLRDTPQLVLTPGDVAVASNTGVAVSHKLSPALSSEMSRYGVLVFDNTPLSEVAQEFNRYNGSHLIITDPVAARIGIGGTFKANDVAAFTEVAQSLLGLHVENHGGTIAISRGDAGTH